MRIAAPTRAETGLLNDVAIRAMARVSGTEPPQLFRAMALRPKLFRGWLRFAGRLMPGGKLPRRTTELVILRVAHLTGCAYEWEHHKHLGKRAGVTAADVQKVELGPQAFEGAERLALRAVDALHMSHDLDDDLWRDLRKDYGDADLVELVLLVGHYEMLATFIGTFRIPPDRRTRSTSSPAAVTS